ncbi:MAG: hypothetical protein M3Z75_29110 [Actinomycetota bacterium]|nr:hypothetical protein [Actinomycetota bacterium]
MRGKSPVLARLVRVSAAVLGAGLLVSGCSPVKMGAAAIVGSQRITIVTLDSEVTNLSQTAKLYPGVVQLTAAQETQDTLSWLVRFKINEQLAQQDGITVSAAQGQQALAQILASVKASSSGVANISLSLILAHAGIPPDMSAELGRFEAIETQFVQQANGGTLPTAAAAQTAAEAKLQHAQCTAAKTLKIEINPQYGQLNYTQFQVVPVPGTLSRAGGAAKASPPGLTPAC